MRQHEATQRYFDARSGELTPDRLVSKWKAIAPMLQTVPAGARILECGAGTGLYTLPLLAHGFHVTAIDFSSASLAAIQAQASASALDRNLTLLHGEFCEVAGKLEDSFHVVLFAKTLHHFPDRLAIHEALRVGYSRLNPGGILLGFEPNGDCFLWAVVFLARGLEHWKQEKNTFLIRRRFLERVFRDLDGAESVIWFRYFIPGSVIARAPWLDGLDRLFSRAPVLRLFSGNLLFRVRRGAGQNRMVYRL
jgi:SAM-dependent methyltransferase